jgi:PAS domain S-box-containing protein
MTNSPCQHLLPLHEREERYRLLIEHIPAITYIAALDGDSSTLYTSPQIETLLGFTQAEWMADPTRWLQQIYPDDRPLVLGALRRIQAGEPAPCEYRMVTRDGRLVWFRDEAALMCDEDGQPCAIYGVMLDITERKQLEDELALARRRLAQSREAERMRIACDLHDGPVQQLLGLGYLLDECQRKLATGWHSEVQTIAQLQSLETIRREVVDVAGQLRTLIGELRPAGLAEFGLAVTLEGYVRRLWREGGDDLPAISLNIEPDVSDLPLDVAHCLFRIGQEALRNALKHAHARQITLTLQRSPGLIALGISDDGRGFCAPERLSELALNGHFGLVGLAEQVAAAGGYLTICSRPGQGTSLLVRIERRSDGARL